jgi:hypothetical protein
VLFCCNGFYLERVGETTQRQSFAKERNSRAKKSRIESSEPRSGGNGDETQGERYGEKRRYD